MKIDLSDIRKQQVSLDKTIYQNHNLTYADTIEKLYLALAVELAELANEVRCFKFWSFKQPSAKEVILDEYADGIHFVTSIAIKDDLQLNFDFEPQTKVTDKLSITRMFNDLFVNLKKLQNHKTILDWYQDYLQLGFALGFSLQEIKQAYFKKHEVNLQRQKDKY